MSRRIDLQSQRDRLDRLNILRHLIALPAVLVGSAARGISRRLRDHGYRLAIEPQSFFVKGTPGPLEEGELDRASAWGRTLANEVMSPTA